MLLYPRKGYKRSNSISFELCIASWSIVLCQSWYVYQHVTFSDVGVYCVEDWKTPICRWVDLNSLMPRERRQRTGFKSAQWEVGDVVVDSGVGVGKWNLLIGVWSENDHLPKPYISWLSWIKLSLAGQLRIYCLILYSWYRVGCLCL